MFDTGSEWRNTKALRERIESGELAGPRIRSTGEIVFPKGGAPKQFILELLGAHWFPAILASLTTAPATRFGDAGRLGRVAAGQIADLVVLGTDPNDDAKGFADVRYTLKAETVIYDASAEVRQSPRASAVGP